jgi:ubiquinone/menaquinone biosynthesis C-methylase UbiE
MAAQHPDGELMGCGGRIARAVRAHEIMKNTYISKLVENLTHMYRDELGIKNYAPLIQTRIERKVGKNHLAELKQLLDVHNKKILDVESGWGEFVFEASKVADCTGIEPDQNLIKISRLLSKKLKIIKGFGEDLPFKDNIFDIVTCFSVLEHVNNLEKTISELVRVCKKGGSIYIVAPNYLFPYEGHYNLVWFPLLPKCLGSLYLKLRGKNSDFFQKNIWYTTQTKIIKLFKKCKNTKITNLAINEIKHNMEKRNILIRLIGRILITFKLNQGVKLLVQKL